MNEKLQRLSTKMVGLFSEDFKNAQDCYIRFNNVYKQQFEYFQNFDPSNILKLVLYIYSLKNTGNFKLAENILNKSGFASLFIMEPDYYQAKCDECGGDSSLRCGYCGGEGSIECNKCIGNGTVNCETCNGDGRIEVDGEDNEYVECDYCYGSGEVNCDECGGGGNEECNYCGGDGGENCSTCDGDGQVETNEHEYKYYVIITWNSFIKEKCELESGTMTPAFSEYDFDRLSDEYIVLGYDEEHSEFRSDVTPNDVYCANYEDEPELHKSYSRDYRIWMDNDGLENYKL
jgi:hypothetical protein